MKKKPKLDDVDVVFQPSTLTPKEKKLLKEYIRQDKARRANKSVPPKSRKRVAA